MKYYNAYNEVRNNNPKNDYKEDYDAIVNDIFDNAFNIVYDDIEFEYEYGSNKFESIPKVRVDSVINYTSSMVVNGDDFKTFIFLPNFPKPKLGMKFKWGENYWLVISTNNDESLSTSAEVRRCNNVLRFFDEYGNKIYEPCIIDTTLRFTKNVENYPITIGSNEEKFWCQRNDKTTLIKPNDKFLFGVPNQRTCFRVYGAGTKNVLNTETMNDNSPSLSEFYIHHYQYNEEFDDLKNGFANAYMSKFSIEIDDCPLSYINGTQGSFNANVYKDTNLFITDIRWESSNNEVLTINEYGSFDALTIGDTIIKASMKDNENIFTTISIKIIEEPVEDTYSIVINPDINYILQDTTTEFSCYLYKNGEKQNDGFSFIDVSSKVPKSNYSILIQDDNHFSIVNKKKHMDSPLMIDCVSNKESTIMNIILRGLY